MPLRGPELSEQTMQAILDLNYVRSQFPALSSAALFLDNAGGSQVLGEVTARLTDYLTTTNVQPLQSSYPLAVRTGERLLSAQQALCSWINARRSDELVLGSSTTLLLHLLSQSIARTLQPGDEIIVTDCDHEANIGPWDKLRACGAVIRTWKVRPDFTLRVEDLARLLTKRTRLVCLTHCSNVFGTINPIREAAAVAHAAGAQICVDGVAYAPHREIDVQSLDVDFYALSFYKAYGPHYALLYAKRERLLALPGINHFFVAEDDIPYKLQPGNANYEFTYASAGIAHYFENLGARLTRGTQPAANRQAAYQAIATHEEELTRRLLGFLNQREDVIVLGDRRADAGVRVPTVSFVVRDRDSRTIIEKTDRAGISLRCGDMYAKRYYDAAGLSEYHGIIRASLVHYNSIEDVEMLIEGLNEAL